MWTTINKQYLRVGEDLINMESVRLIVCTRENDAFKYELFFNGIVNNAYVFFSDRKLDFVGPSL